MRLSGTKATAIHQYRGLGSQLWDLAGVRPSLDLPFADEKSLVDATTGSNLVDFTRASSGTYVGSDGLIKTATTNLLLQSEDFSTTWLGTDAVTTNTADSPFGELSADTLTYNSVGSNRYQNVTTASSTTYTFSVWMRAVTGTFELKLSRTNAISWTGATVSDPITLTTEWQRYSLTFTTGASDTASGLVIGDEGLTAYNLPATGSIYAWGAQLEKGTYAGDYAKTEGSAASTARTAAYLPDGNGNFVSAGDLLLEGAGTNLLLRSEEFDNATVWTPSNGTVSPNTDTAPDGTLSADKFIPDAASNTFKELQQNASVTTGTVYTFSQFVKAAGYRYIQLVGNGSIFGTFAVNFDLQNGVETSFAAGTSTVVNRGIQAYGNGWYRVFASVTCISTASGRMAVNVIPAEDSVRGVNWSSDGSSGVLFWGAQLEANPYPTSYIPTTGSTATRAADVSTSAATFGNSWYEQSEGTFFVRTQAQNDSVIIVADDGGFSNRKPQLAVGAASAMDTAYVASNSVVAYLSNSNTANTVFNGAVVYKVDDYAAVINGGTVISDTAGALPSNCTALRIGAFFNGGNPMDGTLRRLTYWPQRLSNDTLQTITT